jgi:hypothetical protein
MSFKIGEVKVIWKCLLFAREPETKNEFMFLILNGWEKMLLFKIESHLTGKRRRRKAG